MVQTSSTRSRESAGLIIGGCPPGRQDAFSQAPAGRDEDFDGRKPKRRRHVTKLEGSGPQRGTAEPLNRGRPVNRGRPAAGNGSRSVKKESVGKVVTERGTVILCSWKTKRNSRENCDGGAGTITIQHPAVPLDFTAPRIPMQTNSLRREPAAANRTWGVSQVHKLSTLFFLGSTDEEKSR